ncbi:TolC family protein [Alienimonas chondri]|uniref:Uncharacterized protein n=1 Tax=Alienimonas chondri TaxID=2681879 RepID=A0ABX1VE05_9PLAN|nr:TolC family protein [Alienimonas chondri]NNJ25523.1 hypothetical protein [Alienimonas chondri]
MIPLLICCALGPDLPAPAASPPEALRDLPVRLAKLQEQLGTAEPTIRSVVFRDGNVMVAVGDGEEFVLPLLADFEPRPPVLPHVHPYEGDHRDAPRSKERERDRRPEADGHGDRDHTDRDRTDHEHTDREHGARDRDHEQRARDHREHDARRPDLHRQGDQERDERRPSVHERPRVDRGPQFPGVPTGRIHPGPPARDVRLPQPAPAPTTVHAQWYVQNLVNHGADSFLFSQPAPGGAPTGEQAGAAVERAEMAAERAEALLEETLGQIERAEEMRAHVRRQIEESSAASQRLREAREQGEAARNRFMREEMERRATEAKLLAVRRGGGEERGARDAEARLKQMKAKLSEARDQLAAAEKYAEQTEARFKQRKVDGAALRQAEQKVDEARSTFRQVEAQYDQADAQFRGLRRDEDAESNRKRSADEFEELVESVSELKAAVKELRAIVERSNDSKNRDRKREPKR